SSTPSSSACSRSPRERHWTARSTPPLVSSGGPPSRRRGHARVAGDARRTRQATGTRRACIYVLAGVDGAGKSSIGGAAIRQSGADYFNPDEATQRILAANPGISPAEANSAAWHQGKRLLERAIAERLDYAFETTLGGDTIRRLL